MSEVIPAADRITIYQKPTCTTCRQVYKALQEAGADFDAIDYFVEPIPKSKMKELLSKMGIHPRDLLRTNEPVYRELGLNTKEYSEGELIDLMCEHPDLIQRPIVEKGKKAIVARPAARLNVIFEEAQS